MNITIRQRENGKWQAIVSYKDKKGKWRQKPKGGFDKRKDANLWAKEMSFELQKLEKSGVLGNEYTLEEIMELYLTRMKKSSNKNSINSENQYRSSMGLFEEFLHRNINEIKATELFEFIEKKREKTGYSYNTNIKVLSTIFNFAIKKVRACINNPCDLLYNDYSRIDDRTKFIDDDFYHEILSKIKKQKMKLLIKLLYETGIRIGEALGLCTQNVANCSIKIDKQFLRSNKLSNELKTKNSYRTVPISPELFKELKTSAFDIDGRIFYDLQYQSVYYNLSKFNISPHCFRHTRATILVSSGIDLTVIASVIGDDIQTILSTYVEVNNNEIEEKFEQIRSLL